MADLGDITARLTADVGSFTSGMGQATTAVENFQTAAATATTGTRSFYEGVDTAGIFAAGSERGIRRMELALGAMAAQTVGTSHAVGTLVEGMLLFGGGSPVALAVLGGIAAIGAAFVLLQYDAEGAKKATEDLQKELEKMGPHGKVIADQMKVDALQQQIDALQKSIDETPLSAGYKGASIVNARQIELIGLQQQMGTLQTKLAQDTTEFNNLLEHRAELDADHAASLDVFVVRTNEEAQKWGQVIDKQLQSQQTLDAMNEATAQMVDLFQGPTAGALFRSKNAAAGMFPGDMEDIDKAIAKSLEEGQKVIDKAGHESERLTKEWGNRISRALVDGLTGNLNSLGDLMKSILEAWISKNVIQPFLISLGIFSPSSFGMYVGEMVAAGIGQGFAGASLGKLGLNMNLNVNNAGAPADPMSVARDATWQRSLRESLLVAQQQGFALPIR